MYLTDERQEQIDFMEQFPEGPREDLIARYFYHHKISNGFVLFVCKVNSTGIGYKVVPRLRESRLLTPSGWF